MAKTLPRRHAVATDPLPRPQFAGRVPSERIRVLKDLPVKPRQPVVYWMSVQHRFSWNYALDRAFEASQGFDLSGPYVFDTLSAHQRATLRHVNFWWDSVVEHRRVLGGYANHYLSFCPADLEDFLEKWLPRTESYGLLIVDDFPLQEHQKTLEKVAQKARCRVEAVDSCGLLPLSSNPRLFLTARGFRSFLLGVLPDLFQRLPDPREFAERLNLLQPVSPLESLNSVIQTTAGLSDLEQLSSAFWLDQNVPPVAYAGGTGPARKRWTRFLSDKILRYHLERNHPDAEATSGLSPYLHFGMISPFELVAGVWSWLSSQDLLFESPSADTWKTFGSPLPDGVVAFLDQLLVWRELGFNFCKFSQEYKTWDSLPEWAKRTLTKHRHDPRPKQYSRDALENAATDDILWNAAQTQLREEGVIHNYLRMIWGKKLLEWTATPEEALQIMVDLNDKYALDGSDPNSYSGIGWVLGRYDRPWGPERAIYGTVRYMSTHSAMRKLRLKQYLCKFCHPR